MNNYGGYRGGGYGGYGGYGGGMFGGRGPRNNGPTSGQIIFFLVLVGLFMFWWNFGGGQDYHAKYTKAQEASAKIELKKKANHDERITSSQIAQQNGQTDGTNDGASDNEDSLENLATKFDKKKYPNYIDNLGSATFSEDCLNTAAEKQQGHAWYGLYASNDSSVINYGDAYINSKAISESSSIKFDSNKTYLLPINLIGVMNQDELLSNKNITDATSNAHKAINSINSKVKDYLSQPNRDVYYSIDVINDGNKIGGYHIMVKSVSDNGNSLNINDFVFNK